jgi:methyl-accepting chemotaxis protein
MAAEEELDSFPPDAIQPPSHRGDGGNAARTVVAPPPKRRGRPPKAEAARAEPSAPADEAPSSSTDRGANNARPATSHAGPSIASVIDAIPRPTVLIDENRRIEHVNALGRRELRAIEHSLVCAVHELAGRSISTLVTDPDELSRIFADPESASGRESPQRIGAETFAWTFSPLVDRDGRLRKIIGVFERTTNKLTVDAAMAQKNLERMGKVRAMVEYVEQLNRGDYSPMPDLGELDPVQEAMYRAIRAHADRIRERTARFVGVNNICDTLLGRSEQLGTVAGRMVSNADSTSSQVSVVSAAAEEVDRNVQSVATGAEEMTASIREIAKSANEAARVATQAVKVAEATNATVQKLGESSAQIGKVIKVITSIAQQTNLLALNATIEAARAGTAGKGFAVVASEVKELAKETAKATEDISQKIEAIQTDTRGAVAAIGQISSIIGQIADIQSTIASAVEEQTATTNEISRSVSEAAQGSAEIARNITDVAQTASGTSADAKETRNAAGELARLAAELRNVLGQV